MSHACPRMRSRDSRPRSSVPSLAPSTRTSKQPFIFPRVICVDRTRHPRMGILPRTRDLTNYRGHQLRIDRPVRHIVAHICPNIINCPPFPSILCLTFRSCREIRHLHSQARYRKPVWFSGTAQKHRDHDAERGHHSQLGWKSNVSPTAVKSKLGLRPAMGTCLGRHYLLLVMVAPQQHRDNK